MAVRRSAADLLEGETPDESAGVRRPERGFQLLLELLGRVPHRVDTGADSSPILA